MSLTLADVRDNQALMNEARLELARRDFYSFCRLMFPRFYLNERWYLAEMCCQIARFISQSDKHFLVINCPPRFGKSLTAQNLSAWLFGQDPTTKIMTASYNEKVSSQFARSVRNMIQTKKLGNRIVYSDVFPWTQVKYGEASAQMWALENSGQTNYLATSPGGTATGFGAHYLLVDDIIKSAEEAYNDNVLNDHWEWFNNTMLSRTEGSNWKIIAIMTRWANGDLAGRIIDSFGDDVEQITYKAVQDDGSMLCESILSRKDYEIKTKEMNVDIAEANYNQKPIDVAGRLYSHFNEWERLPADKDNKPLGAVINFTDTADTGADYLCSISGVEYDKEFYITDLVFTNESMEVTEPAVANLLDRTKTSVAHIESNNGGRGFARNVEAILKQTYSSNRCQFKWESQTHNKESRILASSAWVQNHVYMPLGWKTRYPEFYKQVMSYQRKGRNAHDDAVDVLASIYEYLTTDRTPEIIDKSALGLSARPSARRGYWS